MSPHLGLPFKGMVDFLFQGMEFAFDFQVDLSHLSTPIDDGLPKILSLFRFQPCLHETGDDGAAFLWRHAFFKSSERARGEIVGPFNELHWIASILPNVPADSWSRNAFRRHGPERMSLYTIGMRTPENRRADAGQKLDIEDLVHRR
jgi:hypothetical protein